MTRKPHSGNAGYVSERVSKHPKLPGHFVIYDRNLAGIDAEHRWIVVHEPSRVGAAAHHVAMPNLPAARALMVAMARGEDVADFGQWETSQ